MALYPSFTGLIPSKTIQGKYENVAIPGDFIKGMVQCFGKKTPICFFFREVVEKIDTTLKHVHGVQNWR